MEYQTLYTILDDAARVPWTHVLIGLVVPPVAAAAAWPGFNRTESHGGPIHASMRVRIHQREGSILQIEVPRGP